MIYAIYKRYKGSGIADILVAAGVIAEGSVDQAFRGKHYRRALRCLSLMYETLMHLLLNKNLARLELDASTKTQLDVLCEPISNSQECLTSALEKLENDSAIDSLICSMFQDLEVSDMANYWIDFMSMVEVPEHIASYKRGSGQYSGTNGGTGMRRPSYEDIRSQLEEMKERNRVQWSQLQVGVVWGCGQGVLGMHGEFCSDLCVNWGPATWLHWRSGCIIQ